MEYSNIAFEQQKLGGTGSQNHNYYVECNFTPIILHKTKIIMWNVILHTQCTLVHSVSRMNYTRFEKVVLFF